MSRSWSLVIAGVFLTGSVLCAYFAWESPKRGLEAVKPIYDFGELTQGQTVTAELELVNRDSKPVEIKEVLKSCDCAEVKIERMKLAPGERTGVKAVWTTGSKRGPVGTEIGIVYLAEGSLLARLALHLKATILPDIKVSHERLVFAAKKKNTVTVCLAPGRMKEFSVNRVWCTHRAFRASLQPNANKVEVSFDPAQWPEDHPRTYLCIATNSPNERVIEIELSVADGN